jgi:hypothetical protein
VSCHEGILDDLSGGHTFQSGAHEGISFSGFDVLEFHNDENVIVVIHAHSISDI